MKNKKTNKKNNLKGTKNTDNTNIKNLKSTKNVKNTNPENMNFGKGKNETPETFNEMNKFFRKIQTYPVLSNEKDMLEAKNKLVKMYKKGSDNIRQTILYISHNFVFGLDDIRQPQSTELIKRREHINDDAKLRIATYQRMFNYNTSFEGIHEIITMLAEIDDSASAKLLTHLLSHALTIEVEGYRMIRNDVVSALGKMTNTYALKALLYYHSVSSFEPLTDKLSEALSIWMEKLDKLNIPKHDKEKMIEAISMEIGNPSDTPKSQYR